MPETVEENGQDIDGADKGLGDSINAITRHITKISVKKIEEDYINPLQQKVTQQLTEIHEQQARNEELFETNVMEAVRRSRRSLIEERLKEFDVADIIQKLAAIPLSIGANMTNLSSQRDLVKTLQNSYDVEIVQLITAAAQQGMIGGNTADRETIKDLIEDRARNAVIHGYVISLTVQATAKGAALMECSNLDVAKAAATSAELDIEKTALANLTVEGSVLEMQFKSLRAIVSLINSMSS